MEPAWRRGAGACPRPPPLSSLPERFLQVATASPSLHRDESVQAGALYAQSRFGAVVRTEAGRAGAVDQGAEYTAARDPAHVDALLDLYAEIGIARGGLGVPAALAASPTPDGQSGRSCASWSTCPALCLRATGTT